MSFKQVVFLVAFLEGGLVMLLELCVPHVVAPVLGNSVSLWGILISLSAGSLAIGYFLGGFLSKRSNLIMIAVYSFIIALIAILLAVDIIKFQNVDMLFEFEATTSYLIIFLGLIVPTIAFGASTPLLVSALQKEGITPGIVYSFSTWGGVLFTLLTGFLLIPDLGLIKSLNFSIVLILVMIVILLYNLKKKWMNYFFLGIVGLSVIHFFIDFSEKNNSEITVLEHTEGLNGQLMVTERKVNDNEFQRTLFINRMGQTKITVKDNSSIQSNWSYPAIIKSLSSIYGRSKKDALVLGLGGGIVPLFLSDKANLNFQVDAVELDQKIIDIAKDHFYLPPVVNVINDDARRYLNKKSKIYDLIVMDVFNGEIAPSHVLSIECFEKVKESLSNGGLLLINFNGNISGRAGISGRSLYKTLKKAGFQVKILPTLEDGERNRNNIFIASMTKIDFDKRNFPIEYTNNDRIQVYDIEENFIDVSKLNFSDAKVIYDNFPVMESLNQEAAMQWRQDYLTNETLKYRKKGIPLIK